MKEGELSKSLKFALFLLGLFSVLPILVGVVLLFFGAFGLAIYQFELKSLESVELIHYKKYFSLTGVGMALYLLGRVFNYFGAIIVEASLQILTQDRLKQMLAALGQECFKILTLIGISAIVIGLIDNIAKQRPFDFYKVLIVWGLIVICCQVAHYYLGKLISSETKSRIEE